MSRENYPPGMSERDLAHVNGEEQEPEEDHDEAPHTRGWDYEDC